MARKKGNNYVVDEENGTARIELHRRNAENLWTIIDLEDLERVINFPYTWFAKYNHTNDEYYVTASVYHPELQQTRPIFLHQFLMNANGKDVDHENNDTLDNRKSNMRVVEESNNSKNRKGRNRNNKSGYRNVSLIKGKWVVQLQIDGKNTKLGSFDDVHEAGRFAEEMRQKYYGEFAGKNLPNNMTILKEDLKMIKLHDNKAVEVNGKMFSLTNDYNDYLYCWLDNLPSNYGKTTLDELTIENIQKEIEEMKYEKEHGIYTIVDDEEWDNDEYFEALDLYIEILEAIKLSFN